MQVVVQVAQVLHVMNVVHVAGAVVHYLFFINFHCQKFLAGYIAILIRKMLALRDELTHNNMLPEGRRRPGAREELAKKCLAPEAMPDIHASSLLGPRARDRTAHSLLYVALLEPRSLAHVKAHPPRIRPGSAAQNSRLGTMSQPVCARR